MGGSFGRRPAAELEATNGIPGLELVEPTQVGRAAELFARDGFVGECDRQLFRCGAQRTTRHFMAMRVVLPCES